MNNSRDWIMQVLVFLLIVMWVFTDEIKCAAGNGKVCQQIAANHKQGN